MAIPYIQGISAPAQYPSSKSDNQVSEQPSKYNQRVSKYTEKNWFKAPREVYFMPNLSSDELVVFLYFFQVSPSTVVTKQMVIDALSSRMSEYKSKVALASLIKKGHLLNRKTKTYSGIKYTIEVNEEPVENADYVSPKKEAKSISGFGTYRKQKANSGFSTYQNLNGKKDAQVSVRTKTCGDLHYIVSNIKNNKYLCVFNLFFLYEQSEKIYFSLAGSKPFCLLGNTKPMASIEFINRISHKFYSNLFESQKKREAEEIQKTVPCNISSLNVTRIKPPQEPPHPPTKIFPAMTSPVNSDVHAHLMAILEEPDVMQVFYRSMELSAIVEQISPLDGVRFEKCRSICDAVCSKRSDVVRYGQFLLPREPKLFVKALAEIRSTTDMSGLMKDKFKGRWSGLPFMLFQRLLPVVISKNIAGFGDRHGEPNAYSHLLNSLQRNVEEVLMNNKQYFDYQEKMHDQRVTEEEKREEIVAQESMDKKVIRLGKAQEQALSILNKESVLELAISDFESRVSSAVREVPVELYFTFLSSNINSLYNLCDRHNIKMRDLHSAITSKHGKGYFIGLGVSEELYDAANERILGLIKID